MFADVVKRESNFTETENGAIALKSTDSALLDLFSIAGATREISPVEIENYFYSAYLEDPLLTLKLAFYTRNIRGGLGERRAFRIMLRKLANINPKAVIKNIHLVPKFGRWDDLYVLVGTKVEKEMFSFMKETFLKDLQAMEEQKEVSLLGKWLKSINASSKESKQLGKLTAKSFGMSEKDYRKALSKLRDYIDVTEKRMSENKWNEIPYPNVPSIAMNRYRLAFIKHDEERFEEYLSKVEKGEEKINSSTLFPYDILLAGNIRALSSNRFIIDNDRVLEQQWKNLPNYIEGKHNILVMADTSYSMTADGGRPIATAIGLAIYFAERNSGPYKDLFLTFSSIPHYVNISGNSLSEKVSKIPSFVESTNIEKAFELILETAKANNISQEEMPESLIIISDMQFDEADYQAYQNKISGAKETFMKTMEKKFASYGYNIPKIVYWQVDARQSAIQAHMGDSNVYLVSGNSPSTFRDVLNLSAGTPYDAMVKILNSPLYKEVKLE